MSKYKIYKIITSLLFLLMILSSCKGLIENRGDARKSPPNPDERVKRNIQEGKGIRFGRGATRGGNFDFASSNPLTPK